MCLVGWERTYAAEDEAEADARRQTFISSHSQSTAAAAPSGSWMETFQAREGKQLPKNCVTLSRDLKENIVKLVFQAVIQAPGTSTKLLQDGRSWNMGGESL